MDDLLAAAGAVNVGTRSRRPAAAVAHTLSDSDTSTQLVLNLLQAARSGGADIHRDRVPDLPLRPRDAPDPRRGGVRH